MIGRLQQAADFQRLLATPPRRRSAHFCVHFVSAEPTRVRPKPRNFFLQPLREFRRRFFGLKGYRDGVHGLRLSILMAWYTFDMYRRLARRWRV